MEDFSRRVHIEAIAMLAERESRIAELEEEVAHQKRVATAALERLEELEEVAGDGDGDWYWRATGDYVGKEE